MQNGVDSALIAGAATKVPALPSRAVRRVVRETRAGGPMAFLFYIVAGVAAAGLLTWLEGAKMTGAEIAGIALLMALWAIYDRLGDIATSLGKSPADDLTGESVGFKLQQIHDTLLDRLPEEQEEVAD
jgi:hypothetical protein